ncbi:MAG TPA: hypothetical protein VIO62_11800, partial [Candidatus Dormibacteraeota bacterium]
MADYPRLNPLEDLSDPARRQQQQWVAGAADFVADADQEALALPAPHPFHHLAERARGLRGMVGGADGLAVGLGAQAFCFVEAQLRAGRVDQKVVPD